MKQFLVLAAAAIAALAPAQVKFNEFMINPPGTDDGFEFFELKGNPNTSLSGLHLLVIEADAGGSGIQGVIDQAIPLSALSTGANGLLLLRDGSIVLQPEPNPQTTVFVQNFTPDIENGGNTYLIVSGFTGSTGTDLDADNDGILDSTPWTSVVDAISYSADSPNPVSPGYAGAFGGPVFPQQSFTPDVFTIFGNTKIICDVLGANPGPYTFDPAEVVDVTGNPFLLPETWVVTPGSDNPAPNGVICPNNVTLITGTPFGGNLASLCNSDDDSYFILNDENDPNAVVEITGTGASTTATSIKLNFETAATRTDISEFVEAFNYATNAYQTVSTRTTTLADAAASVTLAPGANFVSGTGEVKVRIRYIPQADLEAADGWAESIDVVTWEVL